MTDKQEQESLLEFATDVIQGAGDIALQYFRQTVTVENKADSTGFDPVTVADREIETYIRNKITTRFPGHSILGEEQGTKQGEEPYQWVIDPIDGTRAFISGSPMWGILMGLVREDEGVLGLMHQPYLQETFTGSAAGAFIRRGKSVQAIATRTTQKLEAAILYCTHPSIFATASDREAFLGVADACQLMRYGGDCYAYCLLACGCIDLVIEGGLQPYDIIPLIPVVEAAGGVVTNWEGNPALQGGNIIAAANPAVHAEAIELLRSSK